jgi:hypothetical protein
MGLFLLRRTAIDRVAGQLDGWVATDPSVSIAAGRALFRANDLLELVGLVRRLASKGGGNV